MASMYTSIEHAGPHRRRRTGLLVALLVLAGASPVTAHDLPGREGKREIVRLQGYRNVLPEGLQAQREMVLSILGEEHKFQVVDWRRFRLTDEDPQDQTDPTRFTLQAERAVLVKIASARPEQRVTILGERRATSSDIFVLALDLCPPE
jgi:hypothetical protein